MRNLKKILALVLALIMSLSLMATAGAKDFPDSDGITNDDYALAVDILSDLGVFNGDQHGNFNPEQSITRAEVAAIVYRIATGDIGAEGNKTYAPYNQFPDIMEEDWYAGYVTYCANAGYIKGRNTGKFDPKDPVTGYEVLAMILRAVGYDKNNEFVGSNWQLNTASTATQRGVLENVLKDGSVRLSEPASRQVVAEMLFRAILIPQVTWNAATLSYVENGETLAKTNLDTEKITGVVMANQWANINEKGTSVLPEDKTQLKPEGESANLTLDIATELEAVGLTYNAYIQGGTKVLGELEYSDKNVDNSNDGKKAYVSTVAGRSVAITEDTVYFLNYSEDFYIEYKSDYLIRYAIAKEDAERSDWDEYITGLTLAGSSTSGADPKPGHTYEIRTLTIDGEQAECYVVAIQPKYVLTDEDFLIMRQIFWSADRLNRNPGNDTNDNFVLGEVYVGTNSYVDVSDWNTNTNSALSWDEFVEKFLNPADNQNRYDGCGNGESLRVIDNNGDGKAEYVFKVQYWQDQAVGTYKDALEFNDDSREIYYCDDIVFIDEIAVGDVVNYTSIDGLVTMYKADEVTGTVTNKNFRDTTITISSESDPRGQSAIFNQTGMDEDILQTADVTEYKFYLDEYGYIRSYKLAQGNKYALVTEMYSTSNQAYNYVSTGRWTAEIKAGEAALAEYNLANPGTATAPNPFISAYAWTNRVNRYNTSDLNFLQPAIAHLTVRPSLITAVPYEGATAGTSYGYSLAGPNSWNRGVFEMIADASGSYGVFDYGKVDGQIYNGPGVTGTASDGTNVNHSFSFTNVAAYALDDNGNVTLNTPVKLLTNNKNEQLYYGPGGVRGTIAEWVEYNKKNGITAGDTVAKVETLIAAGSTYFPVYETDYVQLVKEDVTAGKNHFYIDPTYAAKYNTNSNGYVNATVDTEFYIAMPNNVLYQVGYSKLPTIDDENIRAVYALANNTSTDASGYDYWVADVIVIEVIKLSNAYESVSLMYYNPYETSGSVRFVQSLNSEWRAYQPDAEAQANIPVIPKASDGGTPEWGNHSWTGNEYGFYEVYDSAFTNGELAAGDVKVLAKSTATDWDGHGIYAGTIQRIKGLTGSEYIDVDFLGRNYEVGGINDENVRSVYVTTNTSAVPIYRVNAQGTSDLRLGRRVETSDVKLGDEIILVYNKAGVLAYIVDLGQRDVGESYEYNPQNTRSNVYWLWNTYTAIRDSQKDSAKGERLTFNIVLGLGESATFSYNGIDQKTYWYADGGVAQPAELTVPKNMAIVTFQVKLGAGTSSAMAVVPSAPWVTDSSSYDAATNTITVQLRNTDVGSAVGSRAAIVLEDEVAATIFTVNGLAAYADNIKDNVASMTLEQLEEAKAVLADAKNAANKPTDSPAVVPTAVAGAETAIATPLTTKLGDYAAKQQTIVDAYQATAIGQLTGASATAATTAKSTVDAVLDTPTSKEAIDEAVATYKEKIDELVKPVLEDAPTTAQVNTAKGTVDGASSYEKAAVAALVEGSSAAASAVSTAKNTAMTAINNAKTLAELNAAVDTYKAAIDELIKVTVTFTAANATVKINGESGYATGTSKTVKAGQTVQFKVEPATGYAIVSVKQGETVLTADGEGIYTTSAIKANATVTVETRKMEGKKVSVVNPAGTGVDSNLTVSPTVAEAVMLNSVTLTLKAADGYRLPSDLTAVTVNGETIPKAVGGGTPVEGWSYDNTTGAITFNKAIVLAGDIQIVAAAVRQYTITVTSTTGAGVAAYTAIKKDADTAFSAIGAINAFTMSANYAAPENVVVKMGGTPLTKDTDYEYDQATRVVTFKTAKTITANITVEVTPLRVFTITATGDISTYTPVDVVENTVFTAIGAGEDGAITDLTAAANYDLPATAGVVVKMGSTTLVDGTDYDYVKASGSITFKGSKTVTDNITIEVTGVRQKVTVTLTGAGATNLVVDTTELNKGSDLKGVELIIAQNEGQGTVPTDATKVTLSVNGTPLATGANTWTYADGKITFAANYTEKASGNIQITIAS